MFESFIALFGGLYYSLKGVSEKSKNDAADARTKSWITNMQSDFDHWIYRVVDEQYEHKIGQLSREDERCIKMRNRIESEAGIHDVSDDMIFMGILAQNKKIPAKFARHGIASRGVWDYNEKMLWSQQRKFLLWYDMELQKHGIEPLLFVEGVNENNVKHDITVAQPLSSTDRVVGGKYFWASMRKMV